MSTSLTDEDIHLGNEWRRHLATQDMYRFWALREKNEGLASVQHGQLIPEAKNSKISVAGKGNDFKWGHLDSLVLIVAWLDILAPEKVLARWDI